MATETVRVIVRTDDPDVVTMTEPIQVTKRGPIADGAAHLTLSDGSQVTVDNAVGYYLGVKAGS